MGQEYAWKEAGYFFEWTEKNIMLEQIYHVAKNIDKRLDKITGDLEEMKNDKWTSVVCLHDKEKRSKC